MWLTKRENSTRSNRAEAVDLALLPDTLLVREAKAGNGNAYTELVSRYQDKVYTIVYGQVRSREDALDLSQEVFVKAHQSLGRFREDAVFYTWLYRIAVNACIDYARRRKRSPDPFSIEDHPFGEAGMHPTETRYDHRPYRALENQELGHRIQRAIAKLPETLKLAIILHDIEGLSQKEIAEIMNCPLGTAKSRIQRARCELRTQLQPFLTGSEA